MTEPPIRAITAAWRSALIAVLCLLGIALTAAPALAQTAPVTARGGVHEDFGRLVLDFPQPVGTEIVGEGRHIELKFDRPANLDLGGA
ncbi:MAG TPA: hypothetical protein VMW18_00140, partial [Candidatus Binatia bacterium]|nr:hypothetical protein [Candidatus Binatia bacterium]